MIVMPDRLPEDPTWVQYSQYVLITLERLYDESKIQEMALNSIKTKVAVISVISGGIGGILTLIFVEFLRRWPHVG